MTIDRTRRSLVFHLWTRLTAVTVLFTLLAIAVFVWLEIDDRLATSREYAAAQALAASRPFVNNPQAKPHREQTDLANDLGVRGMQLLDGNGNILSSTGALSDPQAVSPIEIDNLPYAYDIRFSSQGFGRESLGPLDLLMGGEYGSVHVMRASNTQRTMPANGEYVRALMAHEDLSAEAQRLFLRALSLAAAIVTVAAMTIWLLLTRFVARPLHAYNGTALRIARGDDARMPDLGTHEFALLGQTIDDMAAVLRRQASIDALTGLNNVRDLRSRLPELLEQSRQSGQLLTVLVCDLDNMKTVNDTFGHAAGDTLLQSVAQVMQAWAGSDYVCWRTGGDEFVAASLGYSASQVQRRVMELESLLRSTTVEVPAGEVEISMSIGTACSDLDGSTVDALLGAADRRMYKAKSARARGELTSAA